MDLAPRCDDHSETRLAKGARCHQAMQCTQCEFPNVCNIGLEQIHTNSTSAAETYGKIGHSKAPLCQSAQVAVHEPLST